MGERFDELGTEKANPRTAGLDGFSTVMMLHVMNVEDRGVPQAVGLVIPEIAEVVDRAAEALRGGGRLHYFGAGTSGRLGVLDASEVPPTFGVRADLVQGHIAGGLDALVASQEGAEDDPEAGVREVDEAEVCDKDVVVGIAASGRTPYVIGALRRARERGALTVAVACNRPAPLLEVAELEIVPLVGEEVLAGSTRLKSGTAQKLVLNMLSTGIMVRLGRTYGNLMVGVTPTNEKLRNRAVRLVAEITGRKDGAVDALAACGWDVRSACIVLARGVKATEARARLDAAKGSLRKALEE